MPLGDEAFRLRAEEAEMVEGEGEAAEVKEPFWMERMTANSGRTLTRVSHPGSNGF